MEKQVRATDAARQFSEILNQVKFNGVNFTVMRGGKPVARIVPTGEIPQRSTLGDLRYLVKDLPDLEDDAEQFAADIEAVRDSQSPLPEPHAWD